MAPKVSSVLGLFEEHTPFENKLRTGITVLLVVYAVLMSTVFHASYPKRAVELYHHPWWRMLLITLVGIGAWWCPRVGLALGVIVYFYLNDMAVLTKPFTP
jgi:hypothetical protein